MLIYKQIFIFTAIVCSLVSCTKKNDNSAVSPYANAPSTYNFTDANYKQQTVVLSLIDSLLDDLQIVGEPGATAFTASQLSSIYDNTGDLYSAIYPDVSLSGLVSSNGVFFSDTRNRNFFDTIAIRSANSTYLGTPSANTLDSGLYLPEYFEKCFMGSLIYNQANQLFAQLANADNTTINSAYGTTQMIHMWDQLFGYMGMPVDYPTWNYGQFEAGTNLASGNPTITQTDFLFGEYIGHSTFEYTVFTSKPTNYIQNIFNAFIVGRMAIKNNDYKTRDAQLVIIQGIWEDIIASQAISYATNCIANIQTPPADPNILKGRWSEMTGFVHMFQYNPNNKLGATNINLLYSYVGAEPSEATVSGLNNLITLLKTTYGF